MSAPDLVEFLAGLEPAIDTRARSVSTKIVAARIRSELAAATSAGVIPSGTKISVTSETGTLHSSIKVHITAWSGAVFSEEHTGNLMDYFASGVLLPITRHQEQLAPSLKAALRAIETIARRHNYDDSDSMVDHFDVGYYLTVDASRVVAIATQAIHCEASPDFAALVFAAEQAASRLGPAATKSICGPSGVGAASDYALRRLLSLAERAGDQPPAYDKRRGRWVSAA